MLSKQAVKKVAMKVGRDSARNTFSPPHYENENTLARNREPKSQTKMCLSVRVQTLNRIMTSKVALKFVTYLQDSFWMGIS
jgi:hypothetical protein